MFQPRCLVLDNKETTMNRRALSVLSAFALSGLLLAPILSADEQKDGEKKGPPKAPEMTAAAKTALNLHMAFELAHYGEENKVPEALITAARVIGTANLKVEKGE